MRTVYVFGHKKPDNDAIMSAVVLSQLLNQTHKDTKYIPCRLGAMPAESAAMLANWDIEEPMLLESISQVQEGDEKVKVILTDHNEAMQSVDGIEDAEIVGLLDHHRLGEFSQPNPIAILTLPWGSSCSILYAMFGVHGIKPTIAQTCCMLSAMMTDMVMLKSPTTSAHDRRIIKQIGEELGIDPLEFGMNIFLNRPTDKFTPTQMVESDIKAFEVGGKKVLIGCYETVDKSRALGMLDDVYAAMDKFMADNDGDTCAMLITDIMEEGSQVLVRGDVTPIERGLNIEVVDEGVWMPGVMSRKKQVAAPVLAAGENN